MPRALPTLNALRAFEAAARLLSVTKAAEELHVTPAAISHQIKALEEQLGTILFRRENRRLLLTDAGQLLLPGMSDGLDAMAAAVTQVRMAEASPRLSVSTTPSLASRWLVPRLNSFQIAHPDIDVRIQASIKLMDFDRDGLDVGIRFGRGDYPGLRADSLGTPWVIPVCSPRLTEGPPALISPSDLRHHTLLHDTWEAEDGTWVDWPIWLRAAGVDDVDGNPGPRFSDSDLTITAAIEGQGVALIDHVLVEREIAAGRLVIPFDIGLESDFGYYVVSTTQAANRPAVKAFREWALAEAGRAGN